METIIPFLDTVETLLSDVKKVRSSELSLKQFAALIDEEFRVTDDDENKHMGKKDSSVIERRQKVGYSVLKKFVRWTTGITIVFLVAFVTDPETTMVTLSDAYSSVTPNIFPPAAPTYNISDPQWFFILLQMLRLGSISLQVERQFLMTGSYTQMCLVNNPLYKGPSTKCSGFRETKGFVYNKLEDRTDYDGHPTIRKSKNIDFDLARLQQLLLRNKTVMNEYTMAVQTNVDYISTVDDLRDNAVLERLENDKVAHIVGISLSYTSSHILREEFPRPQDYYFVAGISSSYLFIDGQHSPSFELKTVDYEPFSMYVQCSGSRRLVFSPPDKCHQTCHTFARTMKPGEIVFFDKLWKVVSEPTKERSVAFVDDFDWN